MEKPIISLKKVWKIYDMGDSKIYANKNISLDIFKNPLVLHEITSFHLKLHRILHILPDARQNIQM